MEKTELFKKELIAFETGEDKHTMFYYNLPYQRDYDLCNWKPLRMFSGNVLKFYQYNVEKPVVLVTDTDDPEEFERLARIEMEKRGRILPETQVDDELEEVDGQELSKEEIDEEAGEFVDMSKITSELSDEELSQILNDDPEIPEEE